MVEIKISSLKAVCYPIQISAHLKLCLFTATRNLKWVKITHIWLILNQTFANLDV